MPVHLDDLVLYCDQRTRRAAFKDALEQGGDKPDQPGEEERGEAR